jgi:hypothetical protein
MDGDIFIDKRYKSSDLTPITNSGNVSVTLSRAEIPKWKNRGDDAELIAHFWKGERWIGKEVCGRV